MVRGKHARRARVAVDSLRFEQLEARRVVSCGDGRAQTLVCVVVAFVESYSAEHEGAGRLVSARCSALSLPWHYQGGGWLGRGGPQVVRLSSLTTGVSSLHTLQSNEKAVAHSFSTNLHSRW